MARIRLLPDGSLQIVNVLRSDAGVYICVANNGVGHPLQKEFELRVIGNYIVFLSLIVFMDYGFVMFVCMY